LCAARPRPQCSKERAGRGGSVSTGPPTITRWASPRTTATGTPDSLPLTSVATIRALRRRSVVEVVCHWVAWLVERKFGPARQPDRRPRPPARVRDRMGDLDSLCGQLCERGLDVVAHQVELVFGRSVGRMHTDLGGWQLEDQPAIAPASRPAKPSSATSCAPRCCATG